MSRVGLTVTNSEKRAKGSLGIQMNSGKLSRGHCTTQGILFSGDPTTLRHIMEFNISATSGRPSQPRQPPRHGIIEVIQHK